MLLLALGCQTAAMGPPAPVVEADPAFDLAAAETFAWRPRSYSEGMTRAENPRVEALIHRAVRTRLIAKGYTEQLSGAADLEVSYRADVVVTWNVDPGTGQALPGVTRVARPAETYRHGTLVLEFLDPETSHTVWQGRTDAFATGAPPDGREVAIEGAVARLLDELPGHRAATATPRAAPEPATPAR